MNLNFLEFEQPIAELEAKIEELRYVGDDSEINISDEIATLTEKSQELTRDIFSNLSPWQISQLARHPQRPYTLDYIGRSSPISRSCTEIVTSLMTRRLSVAWGDSITSRLR